MGIRKVEEVQKAESKVRTMANYLKDDLEKIEATRMRQLEEFDNLATHEAWLKDAQKELDEARALSD